MGPEPTGAAMRLSIPAACMPGAWNRVSDGRSWLSSVWASRSSPTVLRMLSVRRAPAPPGQLAGARPHGHELVAGVLHHDDRVGPQPVEQDLRRLGEEVGNRAAERQRTEGADRGLKREAVLDLLAGANPFADVLRHRHRAHELSGLRAQRREMQPVVPPRVDRRPVEGARLAGDRRHPALSQVRPRRRRDHLADVAAHQGRRVVAVPGVDAALHEHDGQLEVDHHHPGLGHQGEDRLRQPRGVTETIEAVERRQRHRARARSVLLTLRLELRSRLDRLGPRQRRLSAP